VPSPGAAIEPVARPVDRRTAAGAAPDLCTAALPAPSAPSLRRRRSPPRWPSAADLPAARVLQRNVVASRPKRHARSGAGQASMHLERHRTGPATRTRRPANSAFAATQSTMTQGLGFIHASLGGRTALFFRLVMITPANNLTMGFPTAVSGKVSLPPRPSWRSSGVLVLAACGLVVRTNERTSRSWPVEVASTPRPR